MATPNPPYFVIPYYDGPNTDDYKQAIYELALPWCVDRYHYRRIVKRNKPDLEVRVAAYYVGDRAWWIMLCESSEYRTVSYLTPSYDFTEGTYGRVDNIQQWTMSEIYNVNYRYHTQIWGAAFTPSVPTYDSLEEALEGMTSSIVKPVKIDYQGINTSFTGPDTVDWGEQVVIDVLPDSGMILQDPTQGKSISVYNENGYIPFVYANGKITFTVPNAPTNVG